MRTIQPLCICVAALTACGGSVTSVNDGGTDAAGSNDVQVVDVTSPSDGSSNDSMAMSQYDNTVGKACTTDADCHSANGPEVVKCSNSVFAPEDFYPTAVCIIDSCSPVSDDTSLHFCDGPDVATSPGICVAGFNGSVCLPTCSYDQTGDAPTGCEGKDTCFTYPTSKETGTGYCWGGCTQDNDCEDNQKCQTDQGICVEGVTPPTKTFGQACTKADINAEVCNCLYGADNDGYCTSVCIVGQSSTCPQGAVCDPFEYRAYGYSTSNTGMAGYCTIGCATDAGVCPSSATCTNVSASGPDCVPP
jgi:hypothetical protein